MRSTVQATSATASQAIHPFRIGLMRIVTVCQEIS